MPNWGVQTVGAYSALSKLSMLSTYNSSYFQGGGYAAVQSEQGVRRSEPDTLAVAVAGAVLGMPALLIVVIISTRVLHLA